ncbi:hypothetical protein [Ferruginibacter profundus]
MKKIGAALVLLIATAGISSAQKPRVYISDILKTNIVYNDVAIGYNGEKIPLVFLYNPVMYNQLVKKIPADKIDYVIKYSQRQNYPAGLQTIEYYNDEALKPAYLYFVTWLQLNGNMIALIEMPAAENKKMPEALRPQNDIYFLASSFWTNPNFDVGGKKQYSRKIVKENETLGNAFKEFEKKLGDGMIDGTLYFKNTVPVPAVPQKDYVQQFEAAQAIAAKKDKEAAADYTLKKQRKSEDQQRRIDSLKAEKAKVLEKIAAMSKQINEDLAAGNITSLLTRYRYWKIPAISKDIEIKREGILNNEHRYYTVTSRIEFVVKPGTVDLIDETVFSATMNTGKMQETNKETFLHGESFIRAAKTYVFNNARGSRYYEDGTTGSNQFFREPWNYFLEYVNQYNNIPVVPSFEIINVNVEDEVHSVGVRMKMPEGNGFVVYTPVDIYNEMDKVANYNLRIKNIAEE